MMNYFCREHAGKKRKKKTENPASGIPEIWHLQNRTDRQPANIMPPATALTSSVIKISFQSRGRNIYLDR